MIRPDSELDPQADKLLTFDGESSGFGMVWLFVIIIVFVVYKAIGKKSAAIQRSVLVARKMVGPKPGKKERSV